jgi:plasmid stability protein
MTTQTITVNLPEPLFEQLKERAAQSHRSIENELVEVVATVMPVAGELTADLKNRLAQMKLLDDRVLEQLAQTRLSKRSLAQLQSLNNKRQREGLTEVEAKKANALIGQYERAILVRAQAQGILKERGYDLAKFETLS